MNETLPLFQELVLQDVESAGPRGPAPRRSLSRDAAPDRHLRAAWRLSRGMGRYPEHSPQQTRAGLAICRHLKALLAETDHDRRR